MQLFYFLHIYKTRIQKKTDTIKIYLQLRAKGANLPFTLLRLYCKQCLVWVPMPNIVHSFELTVL